MIREDIIDEVLRNAPIEDVVRSYGIELRNAGVNLKCCCPFHHEDTPSFIVSPAKNIATCFGGCGRTYNGATFIMEMDHCSFPEAIKKLAVFAHVTIIDDWQPTPEQHQAQLERDALYIIMDKAAEYYQHNLYENNKTAKKHLDYAVKRWGADYVREAGIGFAKFDRSALQVYANEKGLSHELLKKAGLISQKGNDFFENRLMIPIRDTQGHIIAFTARVLDSTEGTAKYINTCDTVLYKKRETIFGINTALRTGIRESKFYLVEGGPDVLKLQSIGITNTIASLGGVWTEEQLKQLQRFNPTLCWLPDADPVPSSGKSLAPGFANVIKNASIAIHLGFVVTVKEIPNGEGNTKNDPDSYIKDRHILNELKEVDFVEWFASKIYSPDAPTDERYNQMSSICELIASVPQQDRQNVYIDNIGNIYKHKNLWVNRLNECRTKLNKAKTAQNKKTADFQDNYGFWPKGNAYYGYSKDGEINKWTTYILKPVLHIIDAISPKRIFQLNNEKGEETFIELKQEDVTSYNKFIVKMEGFSGKNISYMTPTEFLRLKNYLYDVPSAKEIKELGWQRQGGFFAWGNGVMDEGSFNQVNDYGLIEYKGANYYLPAKSKIYEDNVQLNVFERSFVYTELSNVSFHDYVAKVVQVSGWKGYVGIQYVILTLFKDIIVNNTRWFPILNLFGKTRCGKTGFANSIMAFFLADPKPTNINTGSLPSIAQVVGRVSNALAYLEEYTNQIEYNKIEYLKGYFDNVGRVRMNMDLDKKAEMSNVDSGLILAGEDMPNADHALFTRIIHLAFTRDKFQPDEQDHYQQLKEMYKFGVMHLTEQILSLRETFSARFATCFNQAFHDIRDAAGTSEIDDRVHGNWALVVCAYLCLQDKLDFPYNYHDMLKACAAGAVSQSAVAVSNSDLATFWQKLAGIKQSGRIFEGYDFKCAYITKLKNNKYKEGRVWPEPHQILYLRRDHVFLLYHEAMGRDKNARELDDPTLRHYLINSEEYLGNKHSVKFTVIKDGMEVKDVSIDDHGRQHTVTRTEVDDVMCFDYKMIHDHYDVNLTSKYKDFNPDDDSEVDNRTYNQLEGDIPF